jgi:hypothetical protein
LVFVLFSDCWLLLPLLRRRRRRLVRGGKPAGAIGAFFFGDASEAFSIKKQQRQNELSYA